jgi:pimeloyl-ACP methyl ester carboxylesterase
MMNKINRDHSVYVLVHGAWHGGWCWKKIKPLLEARGHTVYTPTLTGLGERSHLLTPQIDLSTHIEDIVSMLEYENLYNVILVGHCYAGMVISGVAEKAVNRLSHLVYLDAYLPEDGKSIADYLVIPSLDKIVTERGDGWRIPFLGTLEDLGVKEKKDLDWAKPRIGDQPYKTFTETLSITKAVSNIPGTFIQLSNFPWFVKTGERARSMGFNYYQILCGGHDAMISNPEEIALAILQIP